MTPCDFGKDIVCVAEQYQPAVNAICGLVICAGPDEKAVATLGARISNLRSDNVIHIRTGAMSQACMDDVCVYYVRVCKPDRLTCRFVVTAAAKPDQDLLVEPREFEIAASTPDAMLQVEDAITIGLPNARGGVTLTSLQAETSQAALQRFSAWSWD